ncbi:MAG TPA: hypothetical protein VMU07_01335 [Candidatus Paceibacterota bacterium]|nr:hypothetical protein [Candidatus Paceibacterota bacterium]
MKPFKNLSKRSAIFAVALIAVAGAALGFVMSSSAPSAPPSPYDSNGSSAPASPTNVVVPTTPRSAGSTTTMSTSTFKPPTGTPHVNGPSGPPPRY